MTRAPMTRAPMTRVPMTETDTDTGPARVRALAPPTGATSGALYVTRTARRIFDADCEFLRSPRNRANVAIYLDDLLRPYQLPLDAGLLAAGAGQSYGEMALALIEEAVDAPVDLLVLAFAVPDVWPGRATATYLSEVCPGKPLAFAICDQGAAAAFTGLQLIREYVGSGACRRALLLVLEQATLHYPAGSAVVPDRHAGVALVCTGEPTGAASDSADITIRLDSVVIRTDVAPDQVPQLLAGQLAAGQLAGRPGRVTLVAGAGIDPGTLPVPAQVAAPGQPYTGVWWELSARADAAGSLILADYDPALRYLCTASTYCGVE